MQRRCITQSEQLLCGVSCKKNFICSYKIGSHAERWHKILKKLILCSLTSNEKKEALERQENNADSRGNVHEEKCAHIRRRRHRAHV